MAAINQNQTNKVLPGGLKDSETTINKHQANTACAKEEPTSPVWSCVSMKSEQSMDSPLKFQDEPSVTSVAPTCLSMKSDNSMKPPLQFQTPPMPREPTCLSMKSDNSMKPPLQFKTSPMPSIESISPEESCVSMKSDRSMEKPPEFQEKTPMTFENLVKHAAPVFSPTKNSQSEPSQESRGSTLPDKEFYMEFKSLLKNRNQRIVNGQQQYSNPAFLNDIYTELYITEGESGEVNNEHEVRQVETASMISQTEEDKPVKCNDIFKSLQGEDRVIRTVLTKGVAGIGKTVSVQKFILDWAEDKVNQDIYFIFPLPFRELNLLKDQCFSLENLLHYFFPLLKKIKFTSVFTQKIVFIFDGLDEHRLHLDFQNSTIVSKENTPALVSLLLTNLIRGNLLPSALIWITSRPAAASQIPSKFLNQVTEIRGFSDPQKEEYISKIIKDKNLASDVINHLKSTRSLYIMCHIPVFCCISATVLEKMLKEAEGKKIPKTLTQMYTHFFIIQTHNREQKYNEKIIDSREMIFKLGELAFEQLLKGNLIFYVEDLEKCGINVNDAVEYSGVCTQIFREEKDLLYSPGKVFCFVHLSIQEHLAALYVHLAFKKGNKTVLHQWNPSNVPNNLPHLTLTDLHQSAVDKALQCKSGEFDLFLRFLLGISLDSNQALMQLLLPQMTASGSQHIEDTIEYIKIRLKMNLNPEKYINLFHCLNELNDFSLVEEIQDFQKSRRLAKTKLTSSQWSALVFVLLTSGNELDVFDLRKYSMDNSDQCLQKMLPVVKLSRTADLMNCNLTEKGFYALTSALESKLSNLKVLKLSENDLHQSGIRILSKGLQSSHCKVEVLKLSGCNIQKENSIPIFSALKSNPSYLRLLDLSFNSLSLSDLFNLSELMQNPHCRLETLHLHSCQLNNHCCSVLAGMLKNNSSLIELDLSKNDLKSNGIKELSIGLGSPSCKVTVLRLADCGINSDGCHSLCSAMKSNPSHLRELCLNRNPFKDKGIQHISGFLCESYCKLERLSASNCLVSKCDALVSALKRNPTHLKELELSGNKLGTSGQEKLRTLQQHKDYRLEKLKL